MPISCVCDYTANRNLKTGILMYISIQPFSVADIVVRVESEFISFSKAYPSSSQNSIKFIRVVIQQTREKILCIVMFNMLAWRQSDYFIISAG